MYFMDSSGDEFSDDEIPIPIRQVNILHVISLLWE